MAAQLLYSCLIFLGPLGAYCLGLAYLNRSRHPVLVGGAWDCVGLLFGLAGFLLWLLPLLLIDLGHRLARVVAAGAQFDLVLPDPVWFWLGYFALLATGVMLMLAWRRHKTVVYNVDTAQFAACLDRALADAGLDSVSRSGRLVVAPVEAFSTPPAGNAGDEFTATPPRTRASATPAKTLNAMPGGPRYAELAVDRFAAFCNVTLHWETYTDALRREVEDRLDHALQGAPAPDNPAAGWFLGFSGMIIGAVTLLAAFFVVLLVFGRQR